MDSGYSMYAKMLRNRLENYVEDNGKLSDTRMDFRRGRGSVVVFMYLRR